MWFHYHYGIFASDTLIMSNSISTGKVQSICQTLMPGWATLYCVSYIKYNVTDNVTWIVTRLFVQKVDPKHASTVWV